MKKIIYTLISFLVMTTYCSGNNVVISNISVLYTSSGAPQIQFDLSWENSWRVFSGPANYDAAWVFFKYKSNSTGLWTHVYMTGSDNVIPAGFDVYENSQIGLSTRAGAMIFRDVTNAGTGNVSITGIKLGVMTSLPYDIDMKGFAIEMVYIPSAGNGVRLISGDGNGVSESQNAFHYVDNTATPVNSTQLMKADANAFDDTHLTTDGIYVYPNDSIQTSNPIAPVDAFPTMKALWCMKYELSQAGYVDFLNTLTQIQQANRTTAPINSAIGTRVMPPTSNNFRNYIEIKSPAAGVATAVYGCDANSNNIFDEPNDGEWVSCNFLNWIDAAAYMDWSGLAPMSEVQYEHICRGANTTGPLPAVYGEFAWGTNSVYGSPYVLSNAGAANEVITNNTTGFGNAEWANTVPSVPENGGLRNGIFATPTSDRISSGATYYGVMDMTGGLSEYCISMGTVAGRSTRLTPNGNGVISANGYALLTFTSPQSGWPGLDGNSSPTTPNACTVTCEVYGNAGIMVRGGNWQTTPPASLSMATRSSAQPVLFPRNEGYGCRGVLYIR